MSNPERMGKGSIPLLLLHFSLPAIAGLVANALYNKEKEKYGLPLLSEISLLFNSTVAYLEIVA